MQTAVVDRYGPPDIVRIADVPRPAPGADEVLVRVEAVAVTSAESRIRGARFDVVLDGVGNLSIPFGRRLLSPDGVLSAATEGPIDRSLLTAFVESLDARAVRK